MNKKKNVKGFNLYELVIVLVILVIVGGVAIPRFQDIQARARDAATKAALGTLRNAILAYSGREIAAGRASQFATGQDAGWPVIQQLIESKYSCSDNPPGPPDECTLPKVLQDVPENAWARVGFSGSNAYDYVVPPGIVLSSLPGDGGTAYAAAPVGEGGPGGGGGGPPTTPAGWHYDATTGEMRTSTNINGEYNF